MGDFVAIIPAKGRSTRLPGKNLADFFNTDDGMDVYAIIENQFH